MVAERVPVVVSEMEADPLHVPFHQLCSFLSAFRLSRPPHNERELEAEVMTYLARCGVDRESQKGSTLGRFDIVVNHGGMRICLELKKHATSSCAEQLDRYARDFDGLILLCFKATRPLHAIFKEGQRSAKIPIALIEVRKNCEMV